MLTLRGAIVVLCILCAVPTVVTADISTEADAVRSPSKTAGFFRAGYAVDEFFRDGAPPAPPTSGVLQRLALNRGPVFVSNDPRSHIVPPDQVPAVRINPEAPGPFIAMASAYQSGDMTLARQYAEQWVKYQMNFFFDVRQLTMLIGEALIQQKVIDEDEWIGVGQLIDYEFASGRAELGTRIKPSHEQAMERIRPDPGGEVEIYYFFTMSCSWCRKMAPDIERLWRLSQSDKRIKIVGLTLGETPAAWLDEYRRYTGLTMPVYEGSKQAKAFGVGFVPAVVVVSPARRHGYLKTGQQSFAHLWQFVRKAQGADTALTERAKQLLAQPIGEVERHHVAALYRGAESGGVQAVKVPGSREASSLIGRF